MKNVIGVYTTPRSHWVGDGFPVRSLFAYDNHGKALSPFLLLDRAGPAQFAPASSLSDYFAIHGIIAPCPAKR